MMKAKHLSSYLHSRIIPVIPSVTPPPYLSARYGANRIVHPQPQRHTVLVRQLSGQPPAHADVAIVVYHGAENIAGSWLIHSIVANSP